MPRPARRPSAGPPRARPCPSRRGAASAGLSPYLLWRRWKCRSLWCWQSSAIFWLRLARTLARPRPRTKPLPRFRPQPPRARAVPDSVAGGFPAPSSAARQLGRRPRAAAARGGSASSSAPGARVAGAEKRERGAARTGGEASPGAALPGGPAAGERRLRQRLLRDPARRRRPGGHQASVPRSHPGVGAAGK
ncbi:translation initiation factor IF-2-like [Vidua chalybeata]|uniref:translation initiation factor IF-2-like n=1 Tax=Vidua chalybeata TaxID=81927 RepID=UPI0023A89F80|nr:translation initiation factor IF-2-like [Vidua chalybeata]